MYGRKLFLSDSSDVIAKKMCFHTYVVEYLQYNLHYFSYSRPLLSYHMNELALAALVNHPRIHAVCPHHQRA